MEARAGGEHTVVRDDTGSLFSAGACGIGWCRLKEFDASLYGWRRVSIPEPVSKFHASYYHNLAIGAKSGAVWSWGCGTFVDGNMDGVIPALALGPLAAKLAHNADRGGAPTKAEGILERAVDVTGGAYHSVVLTESGKVLTCGAGQLGQLGRSVPEDSVDGSGLPVDPALGEVEGLPADGRDAVHKIGAGFYNTLVASKSGHLFCSGENQNAQCGNEGVDNLRVMTRVRELDDLGGKIASAQGGYCHTLALTRCGTVLTLGCGEDGQRGDGRTEWEADGEAAGRPTAAALSLPGGRRVAQLAAGANHSVVLAEDGTPYAFGSNEYGQCGAAGDVDVVVRPRALALPGGGRVVRVGAGYTHTVLQDAAGRIFTVGQNENGQLALGGTKEAMAVQMRDKLTEVAPPVL